MHSKFTPLRALLLFRLVVLVICCLWASEFLYTTTEDGDKAGTDFFDQTDPGQDQDIVNLVHVDGIQKSEVHLLYQSAAI